MSATFLGVSWFVWGVLALIAMIIFLLLGFPGKNATSATGTRYVILRWFHPLVWLLLAASFFLRGAQVSGGTIIANVFALLALVIYAIFIVTMTRANA